VAPRPPPPPPLPLVLLPVVRSEDDAGFGVQKLRGWPVGADDFDQLCGALVFDQVRVFLKCPVRLSETASSFL